MKKDEIRRLQEETEELERLVKAKESGEISDEDRAKLERLVQQNRVGNAISVWGGGALALAVIILGGWWWAGADEREAERQAAREAAQERREARMNSPSARRRQASYVCTQFVREQLKAPSTAEFPRQTQSAVEVADGEYRATGQVDAENSFGAMLRQPYTCRLTLAGGDWYRLDVQVGN